jgi:hypothetical protein
MLPDADRVHRLRRHLSRGGLERDLSWRGPVSLHVFAEGNAQCNQLEDNAKDHMLMLCLL